MSKCAGPVYLADQGIPVCETCGGCTCCEFVEVDHADAEYRCLSVYQGDGACILNAHEGRPCCLPGGADVEHGSVL